MEHPQNEKVVHAAVLAGELEIDDQGRIWRVAKRTANRWTGGTRTTHCKRVRAEMLNDGGYLQVRVMVDGKRTYAAAHRLVWLHFKGSIPNGMTVNHKHGNKQDNRPEELELATYSDQRRHALDVLKVPTWHPKGERNPKHQATEADVLEMRRRRTAGERIKDIAASFKMTRKAVGAICRRVTWKHLP